MTKILNSLREETSILHQEIEKDNLANKIMDHTIRLEEYKLLLFQNLIAYGTAETQIKLHLENYTSDKTERLHDDLEKLGVDNVDYQLDFKCINEAEAIGAAYVVEGSAMGGILIGKEVANCHNLESLPEQAFFNGKRDNIKSWNEYLKFLRSKKFSDAEIEQATAKAKETFLIFDQAFKMELSKPH